MPPANRLIHEKSPYLLQHAHNPVDWYAWGPEAFAKARQEDKPILVSIGYSTCHWCHVMEKESYEDPEVGALMSRELVCIKVDREERPDVDKIYMTAVSAMTGSGGWPLNVFLTPELKPFFGGTYFPPEPRWGQPAWRNVVQQVATVWKDPEERKKILATGHDLTEALKRYTTVAATPVEGDPAWLDSAYKTFAASFDAIRGGFGPAPKFPMPVYQNFLFSYYARTKEPQALDMALTTLRRMREGGIYDHIGDGFARYSTDADWHVPHFEKMLYDNAQLALNAVEAFRLTQDAEWRDLARGILTYVGRDMTHPEGGFYSAEDADSLPEATASEKKEGAFYVWSKAEIAALLSAPEAEAFAFRYGVRDGGNARVDPHGEFTGKNILYLAHPIPETARQIGKSVEETTRLLASARQTLFAARSRRPRPHLDDKIVSGWNGLMLSAYARAAQTFEDPEDLKRAQRAARFLKTTLYDAASATLFRSWRDGATSGPGIADDYAFVVQGLLDLYEADFDTEWLSWAEALTDQMLKRFYDAAHGGFFMTAVDQDASLLLRVKEDADNVEPSASAIAVSTLLRLHAWTDRADFAAAAQKTLHAYGALMRDHPRGLPQMLVALDQALAEPCQIVIAGPLAPPATQQLLREIRRHRKASQTVIGLGTDEQRGWFTRRLPHVEGMKAQEGTAMAYVCYDRTCQAPTHDRETLRGLLHP